MLQLSRVTFHVACNILMTAMSAIIINIFKLNCGSHVIRWSNGPLSGLNNRYCTGGWRDGNICQFPFLIYFVGDARVRQMYLHCYVFPLKIAKRCSPFQQYYIHFNLFELF